MRRDAFQAIADPTRRAILLLLAAQTMTPNTLAAHFNTSRQAISKHLRILSECALIHGKPEGREVHYSLESVKLMEIDRWLEQFRQLWDARFSQLDQLLDTLKPPVS